MKRLLILALVLPLLACRLMALPESQRNTCITTVHGWHVKRVKNINTLTVPAEIKAEMVAFSAQEETRQLGEICEVGPNSVAMTHD